VSDVIPLCLAGQWVTPGNPVPVFNPYDGSTVALTHVAGDAELDRAADAAVAAAPIMRALPVHQRATILMRTSAALTAARDTVARQLAGEAGKPLRDALTEVDRAAMTFHVASEEARRLAGAGEVLPMDLAPHGVGRLGLTRRVPVGPIAAISPFNFPLNLSAHKLAPALAAGNPIVLKPASKTPLSALTLARLLYDAGLPPGALSVLPMSRETGDRLVTDERFRLLTFTGSSAIGWRMKARAGKKKVILELGGNAGVIVDDTADLDAAAARVAAGGFAFAGQSCISVQRVFVHARAFDEYAARLIERLERLRIGDPLDPATELGPMIERAEVDRVDQWVQEAIGAGARVLTGGRRVGETIYAPTILTGVPPTAKVCAEEAFAPLIVLEPFTDFDSALDAVNRSPYGLQAGVFTTDLDRTLTAFDRLDVGGVIVNDVPTFRIDHMPYGGVKDSGLGREGPRYAIKEMTELKLLVINRSS